MHWVPQLFLIAAVYFFKKPPIITAILGLNILHWQLSKVIPSRMYNCTFEIIRF